MAEGINRKWVLRARPVGPIKDTDLSFETEPIPEPGPNQVLVRNKFLSIDATHRIWMSDAPQYMDPVALNDTMRDFTAGVVVKSNVPALPVGTPVTAFGGVQDYTLGDATNVFPADPSVPLQQNVSIYSFLMALTAQCGIDICKPKAGDVFVVSAAAGSVGSVAGQLAKIAGATVIGIVGSADKAATITGEYGFDAAINYKTENVAQRLKELAPNGINAYFDNVGGAVTAAVFANLANFARIAVCGLIDGYDDIGGDQAGQKGYGMILMRRATVSGFICTDSWGEIPAVNAKVKQYVTDGRIKFKEDIQEGLENYITVLRRLFSGANTGKLILKITD